MKVVNIFGLVVAVHVIVLILIFAIPGCRSSSKNPNAALAQSAEPASTPSVYEPSSAPPPARDLSADLNPPLVSRSSSGFDSVSAPVGATGRQSPTRPGAATTPSSDGMVSMPGAAAPAATQAYTVVRGDSLWSVAKKHGVTAAELARANNLSPQARLQLNQQLAIPARPEAIISTSGAATSPATISAPAVERRTAASTTPSNGNGDVVTYQVRAGDTLGAIARRHNTTVGAIKTFNKLRSDVIGVGDKLMIPPATSTAGVASAPPPTPAPAAAAPATANANAPLARAGGGAMKHVVGPGETLGQVARRYGVSIEELAVANNVTNPNALRPGQELVIPGVTAASAAARTPEPTRYPSTFQPPGSAAATSSAPPSEPRTIRTSDPDNVPVIRVEEPTETIRIEPAPGGGSEPPLFN